MLINFDFNLPKLVDYENNGLSIKNNNNMWELKQNNVRWMTWDLNTNEQLFQFYAQYQLASGHCICTGLGFLLRESWLLQNPNVKKISVIEINTQLIEYHKKFNPQIMEKIEIINCDVYHYKGKCDTLLIDNFEGQVPFFEYEFLRCASVISKNIDCDVMWFWPLECILNIHYKEYIGLNLEQIYNNIKNYFDLDKLPILSEAELFDFCTIAFNKNFTKCNFNKINQS